MLWPIARDVHSNAGRHWCPATSGSLSVDRRLSLNLFARIACCVSGRLCPSFQGVRAGPRGAMNWRCSGIGLLSLTGPAPTPAARPAHPGEATGDLGLSGISRPPTPLGEARGGEAFHRWVGQGCPDPLCGALDTHVGLCARPLCCWCWCPARCPMGRPLRWGLFSPPKRQSSGNAPVIGTHTAQNGLRASHVVCVRRCGGVTDRRTLPVNVSVVSGQRIGARASVCVVRIPSMLWETVSPCSRLQPNPSIFPCSSVRTPPCVALALATFDAGPVSLHRDDGGGSWVLVHRVTEEVVRLPALPPSSEYLFAEDEGDLFIVADDQDDLFARGGRVLAALPLVRRQRRGSHVGS